MTCAGRLRRVAGIPSHLARGPRRRFLARRSGGALPRRPAVALCAFWGGALRGSMALRGGRRAASSASGGLARRAHRGCPSRGLRLARRGAALVAQDGRALRARLNLPEDAALLQGQSLTAAGALQVRPRRLRRHTTGAPGWPASLTASGSAFALGGEQRSTAAPFVSPAAMRPGSHRRARGRQRATSSGSCVRLAAGHRGIGALRLLQGRGAGPSRGGIGGAPLHRGPCS